jgi:hypothetical protein
MCGSVGQRCRSRALLRVVQEGRTMAQDVCSRKWASTMRASVWRVLETGVRKTFTMEE